MLESRKARRQRKLKVLSGVEGLKAERKKARRRGR
jgi:hypothetical protein